MIADDRRPKGQTFDYLFGSARRRRGDGMLAFCRNLVAALT